MLNRARRFALLALVLGLVVAAGADQQSPDTRVSASQEAEPQAEQPVFRTGINYVRVDVIVTDEDGVPVLDLDPEDIEVLEDGEPQTIESFRLITVDGVPGPGDDAIRTIRSADEEESEAQREDTRIFAIFLDDYHVRRGASLAVREPLIQFIQNQLNPLDMVGVMYPLTPVADVRLTRDHAAVASAVRGFTGRKFDYTPLNTFEQNYAWYPAAVSERIRNDVTLSALRSLVVHLGALREGRKAVIMVSEGLSNMLPPQLRAQVEGMPDLNNPNYGDPFALENDPREETAQFFASTEILSGLREVYSHANRANTSIYTLDPRGLATFAFDIDERVGQQTDSQYLRATQDTLRILADQTDGRAFVNRNDLGGALQEVTRDSSAYYLIGYNSSEAPTDGKFHEISVKVRRSGVRVRARKGYWALTEDDTARALAPAPEGPAPEVTAALATLAAPKRGRIVSTWIGTEPGADGRPRLTFVWEPVPPVPGSRREEPVRVSLMVGSPGGQAYFRGRVPDVQVASRAGPGSAGGGERPPMGPSRVTFAVDPGRVQLRISVEDAGGAVLDDLAQDVVVPDFAANGTGLSTPEVIRARNAFELRQMIDDPEALPTASREFHRTERVLIRFSAYGDSTPSGATLLNRAGDPMSALPITPHAVAPGVYQVDVPLASLAPGDYLVEIAAGPEGNGRGEMIAFRVAG